VALALMASGSARWGVCRSPESCPTSLMFTTLELGVEPGVETGGYMVRAVLSVWCSSFKLSSLWRVWRGEGSRLLNAHIPIMPMVTFDPG